jgi:transposase-like protein
MPTQRKKYTAELKARIALEACKGDRSITELSREYHVHPTLIRKWRDQLLSSAAGVFKRGGIREPGTKTETARLHAELDRLKMEADWLKKKLQPYYRPNTDK